MPRTICVAVLLLACIPDAGPPGPQAPDAADRKASLDFADGHFRGP